MSGHTGASLTMGLIDALRASGDLVDVQIEPAFPGDTVQAEAIYAGEILSEPERVAYNETTGRNVMVELNTIPLEVRCASRATADDTTVRLGELMDGVREVIINGDCFADDPEVLDIMLIQTTNFVLGTPQGYLGQALYTITVTTQIP